MKVRLVLSLVIILAATIAIADTYYEDIQRGVANPLPAGQFQALERQAILEFVNPDLYERLATAFGRTTERVWTMIYGEIFCNLTSDESRQAEMGAQVFNSFANGIDLKGNKLIVDFSRHAQVPRGVAVPFETNFEISFALSAPETMELKPLSIAGLTKLRLKQLAIWKDRKLPVTQLVKWQQLLESAGHFDAYNYWLFRQARPNEFDLWVSQHRVAYEAWVAWRSRNAMRLTGPDFQRLRQDGQVTDSYVDPSTGLIFPKLLGTYNRIGTHEFPDKRLGVVIQYRGFARADVFIYDNGYSHISTGTDSDAVKTEFGHIQEEFISETSKSPFSNLQKILETAPAAEIKADNQVAKVLAAMYTFSMKRRDGSELEMESWILLTGFKEKLLKLRFTLPKRDPKLSQTELRSFVTNFLDANPKERVNFFVQK